MNHPSLLSGLLTYLEEAERLNKTPAFQVPSEVLALGSADVVGLPSVATDLVQDGPVWLSVPRLQEECVPALPEQLEGFVTLSANPAVEPVFAFPESEESESIAAATKTALSSAFAHYHAEQWRPWSTLEQPRRRTVALYKALFALQQKMANDGEAPLELVMGVGVANWAHPSGKSVKHPLLTQACFVEMDADTFALAIRPRDVEPQLELDCYVDLEVPGVSELEAFWAQRNTLGAQFNAFQADSFVDVLRAAVGYLDPAGELVMPGAVAPTGSQLTVSTEWVLFARKRSADVFVADVRRFQDEVASGATLPAVIEAFVSEAADTVQATEHLEYRGLSSSSTAPGVRELYFPLPYNDEQVDIARKLEASDGVVVQGPPGSGKTHTIANIVADFLARGKRVLVTSKGDTALAVLQGKLPEGIRDLSVALLANERAGAKQFEHSIQRIAARIASIRPGELQANVQQLEEALTRTHARIALVDADVADFAERNAREHVLDGKTFTAQGLAEVALAADGEFAWLNDSLAASTAPPLSDDQVARLRAARAALGSDLCYLEDDVPAPTTMPSWSALANFRADAQRVQAIAAQVQAGAAMARRSIGAVPDTALQAAQAHVRDALVSLDDISPAVQESAAALPGDAPLVAQLKEMATSLADLEKRRLDLVSAAVAIPDGAERTQDFVEAVARLAEGKSAFKFGAGIFGKSDVKQLLEQCLVVGAAPGSGSDWQKVQLVLPWRAEVRALIHRWNAVAPEFAMPAADLVLNKGFRDVTQSLRLVSRALDLVHTLLPAVHAACEPVFGPLDADWATRGGLTKLNASLSATLELQQLDARARQIDAFKASLSACRGEIAAQLRQFLLARLNDTSADEAELAAAWQVLVDQVVKLAQQAPTFETIREAAQRMTDAGMPRWGARVTTEAVTDEGVDLVLPLNWRAAFNSKVASAMLSEIEGHARLRALFVERAELTAQLASTYEELVAERAWLGVYSNSTDKTKQALQSFLTSIQAMGAGTGVRAVRHRKAAREAMERAYLSVPCWVLPQWRISETLPAEMGLFDLVIIDEASQSDISSLPAILRGKKLLVVGDHKQVSPSAVGVSESKIAAAYDRLLKDQPHGAHMTSDKSIYDLARVVFAGQSVMLKEHFRCVPEIIEYSNREFYNGEIQALRVPRDDERLDPPLVDVFVRGGFRVGDKNEPEAKAIVAEIEAIIEDPWMHGKSIGVVTLLGHEQARLINDMIAARIPAEDIIERDIVVGQPAAFQGRERDIVLLSMVLAPGDRSLSAALPQQQRLNVAMSRARDRMYLFRSVPDGQFAPDSASGRLMAHFRSPFAQAPAHVANQRELCESGFERELFDELTVRGYRVKPQVRSGSYRIDMVVEGAGGKRLAVECDGDRYHGADRWAADMARQRVLERAGWTFWRCFASSFTRRRHDVVLELLGTLDEMGIEPIGEQHVAQAMVESRTVDPMWLLREAA